MRTSCSCRPAASASSCFLVSSPKERLLQVDCSGDARFSTEEGTQPEKIMCKQSIEEFYSKLHDATIKGGTQAIVAVIPILGHSRSIWCFLQTKLGLFLRQIVYIKKIKSLEQSLVFFSIISNNYTVFCHRLSLFFVALILCFTSYIFWFVELVSSSLGHFFLHIHKPSFPTQNTLSFTSWPS